MYEGNIALFKEGQAEPENVLDYPVSQLPAEDRKLLEAGIHVDSLHEARAVLEDYH